MTGNFKLLIISLCLLTAELSCHTIEDILRDLTKFCQQRVFAGALGIDTCIFQIVHNLAPCIKELEAAGNLEQEIPFLIQNPGAQNLYSLTLTTEEQLVSLNIGSLAVLYICLKIRIRDTYFVSCTHDQRERFSNLIYNTIQDFGQRVTEASPRIPEFFNLISSPQFNSFCSRGEPIGISIPGTPTDQRAQEYFDSASPSPRKESSPPARQPTPLIAKTGRSKAISRSKTRERSISRSGQETTPKAERSSQTHCRPSPAIKNE